MCVIHALGTQLGISLFVRQKRLAKQLSETETLLSQLRDEAATATCAAILLD